MLPVTDNDIWGGYWYSSPRCCLFALHVMSLKQQQLLLKQSKESLAFKTENDIIHY